MLYCSSCDIAYEERFCPLCDAKEEIERLSEELKEKKEDTSGKE